MKVMKVKRKLKLKSGRKETDKPVEPKPDQCIVEEPEPLLVTIHDSMKPKHDPQSDETLPAENPQAEEADIGALDCDEKLMEHLPPEGKKVLVELLQPLSHGKDYRGLASRLGFDMQHIYYLQGLNEPVTVLLNAIKHKKISEVISILDDMGRKDAAEDLRHFEELTPSPSENEERKKKSDETKTLRESYDAFLCFAKNATPDSEFVKDLIERMEAPPYNLHLCRADRDFLGGGSYHENTAVVIEKICKKFVVILSKNFEESEGALYESQIAITLSPGAQQQRIIPILLEDAYRKDIPKPMAHLTYLDYPRAEGDIPNFWNRLARSLGWMPSQKSTKTRFAVSNECVKSSTSRGPPRFIAWIHLRKSTKKTK